MSSSLLDVAFAHHVWATPRVIDACLARSAGELKTNVPGTRGPMLETLRHIVAGDTEYLYVLTGDRAFDIDVEHASLAEGSRRHGAQRVWMGRVHLSVARPRCDSARGRQD